LDCAIPHRGRRKGGAVQKSCQRFRTSGDSCAGLAAREHVWRSDPARGNCTRLPGIRQKLRFEPPISSGEPLFRSVKPISVTRKATLQLGEGCCPPSQPSPSATDERWPSSHACRNEGDLPATAPSKLSRPCRSRYCIRLRPPLAFRLKPDQTGAALRHANRPPHAARSQR
jgi:hypothetical protein